MSIEESSKSTDIRLCLPGHREAAIRQPDDVVDVVDEVDAPGVDEDLAADLVAGVVESLGDDRAGTCQVATQETVVLPGRNEAATGKSRHRHLVLVAGRQRIDQELAADPLTAGIVQLRLDRAAGVAAGAAGHSR